MGMAINKVALPASEFEIGQMGWSDYLTYLEGVGVPAGLRRGADIRLADTCPEDVKGPRVATGLAFDHDGDCGIYNMSTVEPARRRGLATALVTRLVCEAAGRGCSTASLQATSVAERVYAAVGFRDLGRFFEYLPGP